MKSLNIDGIKCRFNEQTITVTGVHKISYSYIQTFCIKLHLLCHVRYTRKTRSLRNQIFHYKRKFESGQNDPSADVVVLENHEKWYRRLFYQLYYIVFVPVVKFRGRW